MNSPIGIRLEKSFLHKIEKISREESSDKSTIIRKLVSIGYKEMMKRKSAEEHMKRNITLSEAARRSELTILGMERYLIENGFRSQYSIRDLREELRRA